MFSFSVIETSFNIAWGFLEKSGELGDPEKSTMLLIRFIEDQVRSGERRPLMIANRAIDYYRATPLRAALVDKGRVVWIA